MELMMMRFFYGLVIGIRIKKEEKNNNSPAVFDVMWNSREKINDD